MWETGSLAMLRQFHFLSWPWEMCLVSLRYMLQYQMSRITKDRGALAHDDRLDVLAMACQYWVEQMAADADRQIEDRKQELLEAELDKFINGINTMDTTPNKTTWM